MFVHLGKSKPDYLATAFSQARLFNRDCPIYLLANQTFLQHFRSQLKEHNVTPISAESLQQSLAHQRFIRTSRHEKYNSNGYWLYTCERFFYLEEFIRINNLTDVFHLENDIMLYANLAELLPAFQKNYTGMIGATFENDDRCVPGFMYISNPQPMAHLVDFFASRAHLGEVDMDTIGLFKKQYPKIWIDNLPTVPPEYALEYPLKIGPIHSTNPEAFSSYYDDFRSLFDAAAWGIFLGGVDPYFHVDSKPGLVSTNSVFNPTYFTFEWATDSQNRRIPVITFNGKKIPLNNLHATCKKLHLFHSLAN